MKSVFITVAAFALTSIPFWVTAQEVKELKKEKQVEEKIEITGRGEKKIAGEKKTTQEIVIRNKGDKDLNLKLEINGDKITVNGKPLAEFKDDQVTINNRRMIIREGGDGRMLFNYSPEVREFSRSLEGKLREGKEITRPFLGVTTEKVAEGAKIVEVVKESAAEKAGLKKDDIITRVGDQKVEDGENLSKAIAAKKPKEVVTIGYKRNGKDGNVKATLGERKVKAPMAFSFSGPGGSVRSFSLPKIQGVPHPDFQLDRLHELESLAPGMGFNGNEVFEWNNSLSRQKRLGLKIQDTEEGGNVKVIDVEEGSAAEKAGLKKDDIITEIGGVKIKNTDEAREQLKPTETTNAYTIKAKRGGNEMSFEVKFPKKLKTANL